MIGVEFAPEFEVPDVFAFEFVVIVSQAEGISQRPSEHGTIGDSQAIQSKPSPAGGGVKVPLAGIVPSGTKLTFSKQPFFI